MFGSKISLFYNGEPKEFLLFVKTIIMKLDDSGMFVANAKVQYLCTILSGEALWWFNTLFGQLGSTTITHLNRVVLGLGAYCFPVDVLSKQNRVMCHVMRNPCGLKFRRHSDCLTDTN